MACRRFRGHPHLQQLPTPLLQPPLGLVDQAREPLPLRVQRFGLPLLWHAGSRAEPPRMRHADTPATSAAAPLRGVMRFQASKAAILYASASVG